MFDPTPYEKIIQAHLKKLRSFCKDALDEDDMMQVGRMALVRAHELYDANRGVKYETYANYWVRQALWKEVADMGYPVRYPPSSYHKLRAANGGRVPFGLSLDKELDGESGQSFVDMLVDPNALPVDQEAMLAAMVDMADEIVRSVCNDRESDIVVKCAQGESLSSAGRRHGISRERARQLYERSIDRVRKSPRLSELAEFLEAS